MNVIEKPKGENGSDPHRESVAPQPHARNDSGEKEVARREQMEKALPDGETELTEFVENASIGLHRVGPDGIIQWANKAECELLGFKPEEYIGRHIAEFHSDQPVIEDILARLTRGERLRDYEARLKCKDGSIKNVLIDSCVRWENGRFIHTQCFTRDITKQKQVEKALQESEARLQAELADSKLLQALSAEIVFEPKMETLYEKLVDAAVAIMRSDFASMQMFCPERGGGELHLLAQRGFAPEAAKGWEWVTCKTPSSCGEALRRNNRVVATDIEQSAFLGSDGLAAYRAAGVGSMQSTPLFSRSGQLVGMISTHWRQPRRVTERELGLFDILARQAADVIERRRSEMRLRESEERYRQLVALMPAAIYTCDAEGRITFYNYRAAELWGRKPDVESERFCACYKVFLPDGTFVPPHATPMAISIRERKSFRNIEATVERPDGSRFIASVNIDPLWDEKGKLRGAINVFQDISERKQVEESVARLAAIVESSEDAIYSTDRDGIIQSWNRGAKALYGHTAAEAIGKPVFMLLPQEREDEESRVLQGICREETVENYETLRRRKDGTVFNASLAVSPVKDSRGNVIGISKVARDITEKVRAREILEQTVAERTASLREAVAQMEEFSYSVSHDLRAPLRAMNAYAGVLLEEYGDKLDVTGRGYLEKIQRNSDRMDRLTQDVLTYSRISRAQVQLEPIALERLVKDVVNQYSYLQPPLAEIEIVSPLLDVLGHEPSFGQCIANLLNNAIKFVSSGTKPRVRVRTERIGKNVRVWFEDNGIGIKPEHQERIFQMFERVHPEGKYEGTGIGLTIVRKAVEKMGGKVGLESDGRNGSRFWIELRSPE